MARGRRRTARRIYWRGKGEQKRAWANFSDFADVGGRREPLVPEGSNLATTDPDIADALLAARLKELESARRGRVLTGVARDAKLSAFAAHHLRAKARAGRVTDDWIAKSEKYLQSAVDYFGGNRLLASISVQDVEAWTQALAKKRGRKGRPGLSSGSVRHYMNALSNLYRRAAGEGYVLPGCNPVAAVLEKPRIGQAEARWLEVHDAAFVLEAARTHEASRKDGLPCTYPLIVTFLLTGGRQAEVFGPEVEDVSFDRRTVTFRPNRWRRLKTATSHRTVPLWPQLEGILRDYIYTGEAPRTGLLFRSGRRGSSRMISDVRKTLDALASRAGKDELRTKMFRHTYCAARLQTLDRGVPVRVFAVAKELGHGGDSLVKRVYGHLGEVRHRSSVVEYRADQYIDHLTQELAEAREDVQRTGEVARLQAALDGYNRRLQRSITAHSGGAPIAS